MTATTQTSPDDDNIVDVDGGPPPNRPEVHFYGLALVFMAPALGGFLYGYDIGATSFVLAMIRDSRDHDVWWHNMPSWQQGLLVSALALGGLIGSHIVLVYLSNSIGRRKEMRIAAALYIVGAMLNVMSVSTSYIGHSIQVFFGVVLTCLFLIVCHLSANFILQHFVGYHVGVDRHTVL